MKDRKKQQEKVIEVFVPDYFFGGRDGLNEHSVLPGYYILDQCPRDHGFSNDVTSDFAIHQDGLVKSR